MEGVEEGANLQGVSEELRDHTGLHFLYNLEGQPTTLCGKKGDAKIFFKKQKT